MSITVPLLVGKTILDHRAARKERRAQERADAANNARSMREYNAMLAQKMAEQDAMNQYHEGLVGAANVGHKGRTQAFDLMKQAGDEDKEAREKLAAALGEFGAENKKARLAQAKGKRKGAVRRAVRGGKIKGTTGGAGRGGIRSLASAARAQGLSKAADTASMAAGLSAYSDAAVDEMNRLSELGGDVMAQNRFADWTRRTAAQQEAAANRNQGIFETAAGRRRGDALRGAGYLGPSYLDPDLINRISPNNELEKVGSDVAGTLINLGY